MARGICAIAEINSLKKKHLRERKEYFRSYGQSENVVEIGIQKTLKIPQAELQQPKTIENSNNLTFISTCKPNKPKIFDLVKSGINALVENYVNIFKNIRLIHTKRQPPNLKRILTNSLFTNNITGVFKCLDSRCLSCQQLLLEILYTFKNVGKQFFLKRKITCDSRNLTYVLICSTCEEQYIGETIIGDSKLRDRVSIYRQHIRQPDHKKRQVEKHLRTSGKGNFTIFPFLPLSSNDIDLRREYEDYFMKKQKTKLSSLWKENS